MYVVWDSNLKILSIINVVTLIGNPLSILTALSPLIPLILTPLSQYSKIIIRRKYKVNTCVWFLLGMV